MALQLFPLEVWKVIVEKLKESDDIRNLMMSFPGLYNEPTMRGKFPHWFFEKVIQGICERLSILDNRSLRQVCRRWRDGIDRFIQSHPETARKTGEMLDPALSTYIPLISKAGHELFGEFRFLQTVTELRQILSQWGFIISPSRTSPFFTRELTLWPDTVHPEEEQGGDWTRFYALASSLIERFGSQLHFLNVYGVYGDDEGITRYILGLLQNAPNLKRLKLGAVGLGIHEVPTSSSRMTRLVTQLIRELPVLPALVAIEVRGFDLPSELVTPLETHFSSQLQRLLINVEYWLQDWGASLPALTSFALIEATEEKTMTVLDTLRSPHVRLLSLDVQCFSAAAEEFHSSPLMEKLLKFERLEELHLYSSYACSLIKGSHKLSVPPIANLASVKRLDICYSALALSPSLLVAFPGLEYLRVGYPHSKSVGIYSTACGLLWGVLTPKLKAVSVGRWGRPPTTIWREDWEKKSRLREKNCSDIDMELGECFDLLRM